MKEKSIEQENKKNYHFEKLTPKSDTDITLANKFGATNPHSALAYLRLLNTNTQQERENLRRAKEYLSIRNKIVHMDTKIKKKEAYEIVECINSLCRAINDGRIIIL